MSQSAAAPRITRIDRMWMLPSFQKALAKRQRETTLMTALDECVGRLFATPTSPGLNLETLNGPANQQVLSARINQSFRLILTPLGTREVGLLHFDNHDEAYRWVDRHRVTLPTMLTRVLEIAPGAPLNRASAPMPAVRLDEDDPLAISSARHWRQVMDAGVERYLAYLDEDQRRVAELHASGLLLVKGGAGTGKTAVAIHRLLWQARQPVLDGLGPTRALYLCFNRALASAVDQTVRSLCNDSPPAEIEIATFHHWCVTYLQAITGEPAPEGTSPVNVDAVQQRTYRSFGRLTPEQKAVIAPLQGPDVFDEIEQVIKTNGLEYLAAYQAFNRRGRAVGLKQPARDIVWSVYQQVRAWQDESGALTWNDVPLRALVHLKRDDGGARYRAIVIDEGQDCTPVMVRLARQLLGTSGQLTVLADPAQEIYDCGFQWTQRELRPRGGNTRWLRKTYRTTREIYDLARPLLANEPQLAEELAQHEPPDRHGPRPLALACADAKELYAEVAARVADVVHERPANQIGILAATHQELEAIGTALAALGVPFQQFRSDGSPFCLSDPTVKLMTMHAVKGLDFPVVYVLAPSARTFGWGPEVEGECRRRLYVALTRSSEALTIGLVYGQHHPLEASLEPHRLDVAGSQGRAFANTAGNAAP
jgi:superfamily I DNA/RNA helicase